MKKRFLFALLFGMAFATSAYADLNTRACHHDSFGGTSYWDDREGGLMPCSDADATDEAPKKAIQPENVNISSTCSLLSVNAERNKPYQGTAVSTASSSSRTSAADTDSTNL